jgi:excinuclease ABC subunit C
VRRVRAGRAGKSQYRRFNITGITPGDDYAAMRQALTRRYKRVQDGEGKLPDLLLIDGGQGQLQQAIDVLNELGVEGVPIVGVAKGEARRAGDENLIVAATGQTLFPGPESPASHLVQSVRDEAHRFAITGHRGRREKARETSTLEEISGVGARAARRCSSISAASAGCRKPASRNSCRSKESTSNSQNASTPRSMDRIAIR